MRTLHNKAFTDIRRMEIQVIPGSNDQVVVETMIESNYFKTINDIINNPPSKGWNITNLETLRSRISLQKKLKDISKKSIKIEESEYNALLEAIRDFGILITSTEILQFFDYIKNLPIDK